METPDGCRFGDKCVSKHGDGDKRDFVALLRNRPKAKQQAARKAMAITRSGGGDMEVDGEGEPEPGDIWTLETGGALDASGPLEGSKPYQPGIEASAARDRSPSGQGSKP